jgi:ParB family chromosome partitioning protein
VHRNGTATTRELLGQSDQNDWRTPRKFLDAARLVMGAIDLDPASSKEANETVMAAEFYTERDSGLERPWKGRVWLNPPYGGEARLFVERAIREYQVGNVTEACLLLNSHPTETKWFQDLFHYVVCFVRGRIDFGGPSREVSTTSTHGSAIAYLGKNVVAFQSAFSQFGAVVRQL